MSDIKDTLSDLITCPVCTNVYKEARIFPCLHSLCKTCLDDLCKQGASAFGTRSRLVSCHICREQTSYVNIKNDFRTNELVSRYQSARQCEFPCQACTHAAAEIAWKCIQCDMLICDSCKNAHMSFPATARHVCKSLQEVSTETKQTLQELIVLHKQMEESLGRKKDLSDHYKDYLLNARLDADAKVDIQTNQVLVQLTAAIQTHAKNMKTNIAKAYAVQLCAVKRVDQTICEQREMYQDKTRRMSELLECEDDRIVASEAHNGITSHAQENQEEVEIKEKVVISTDTYLKDLLTAVENHLGHITLTTASFGNPDLSLSPIMKGRLSTQPLSLQASCAWKACKPVLLKQNIQRMAVIGDKLWLPSCDLHLILVLTKECVFLKKITHELLRPMAVAATFYGNTLVANGSNKGLVELSRQDEFVRQLETAGSYHDINTCGPEMVAYRADTGCAIVYGYDNTDWVKKYEISHNFSDPLDTVLLHYGHVIRGSFKEADGARVFVFESGKLLRKFNVPGGFLRVCCTDIESDILISHGRDNSLVVLSKSGKEFKLNVEGGVFCPLDVVFADNDAMFVLLRTAAGTVVKKYTRT